MAVYYYCLHAWQLSSVAELTSFQLSSPLSWQYLPPNPLQKNLLDLRHEGLEGEDRKGSRGCLYGLLQRLAFCFVLLFIFTKCFPVAGFLLNRLRISVLQGGKMMSIPEELENITQHTLSLKSTHCSSATELRWMPCV